MSIERIAATVVASAILKHIESGSVRFGLLARNLPLFDSQVLYNELSAPIAQQKLRLALIGFPSIQTQGDIPVATAIEQAVEWRNNPDINIPIVVILNPQTTHEKVHSLELFNTFEDTDLRRDICTYGAGESANGRRVMWEVLKRNDVIKSIPLVATQLLAFYSALQEGKSPGDALPCLGLMRDQALSQYEYDRNALVRRLQDNHKQVQTLLSLEKTIYRSLARAFDNNKIEQYRQTFLKIHAYVLNPISENLEQLTFDDVMDLFNAPKLSPDQPTNRARTTSQVLAGQTPITIDQYIVEQLLNDQTETPELNEFIHNRVSLFWEDPNTVQDFSENNPDDDPSKFIIDGQELVFPLPNDNKHPLEVLMRSWVQVDNWGGTVSKDPAFDQDLPLPRVFENPTVLKFAPLQPMNTNDSNNDPTSLIDLFKALDKALNIDGSGEGKLADLLIDLHHNRAELVPYRTLFLYEPIMAARDSAIYQLIERYIQSYDRLASHLQGIYRTADQFHDTIEQATAQFLALDIVIVDRQKKEAALLTTLHPLYLWKWAELARRLKNNTEALHQTEKKTIIEATKHLPTTLNTLLLDPKMFQPPRHLDEPRLVLAGEIGNPAVENTIGIPFYEPSVHQMTTTKSIDELPGLIENFLALYPSARLGLIITLIDPPTLLPILKALASLNKQANTQKSILYGARVNVYRTDSQATAYDLWAIEDNETLELFRQNPRWTIHIDLMQSSYERISKTIEEEGPYHITLLFDPSSTVVQPAWRDFQESPNPFVVPIQVRYDSISDTVRIIQSPTSGIFDSYMGVRNALRGELSSITFGTGNKPAIKQEDLERLIKSCTWLIVVDHLHGSLELSSIGRRLAWFSSATRILSVYTLDLERWHEHLSDHLLPPSIKMNFEVIENHLMDVLTIFPHGLLSTIADPPRGEEETTHKALLQNSMKNLLSIVTALYWYRLENPSTVLINLRSEYFRDWFFDEELPFSKESEYLLALHYKQDNLQADIIKIATGSLLPLSEEGLHLDQLRPFAVTLEGLFNVASGKLLMSPIRREKLREILSTVVFAPSSYYMSSIQRGQRTTIKTGWANIINNLFSSYNPLIRLRSIRVAQGTDKINLQRLNFAFEPYPKDVVTLPETLINLALKVKPSVTADSDSENESSPIPKFEQESILNRSVSEASVLVNSSGEGEKPLTRPLLDEKHIRDQADELRRALIAYGIAVASVDTERTQIGPRIVRYWVRLQPPAGRLAEVQKYAVDLARELRCKHVPIIDNIPGEPYVGIDMEREMPEFIAFAPALKALPSEETDKLLIAMGVNPAGKSVEWDLARLPHMLVAGSTGSGKSTFLSTLITSLAWYHFAKDLELLLIDPNKVNFSIFSHLPHLTEGKIFFSPPEAIKALKRLIEHETEARVQLLQNAHCPNLLEFNRRYRDKRLSWIVVVIDEFASIMNSLSRNERETFERQVGQLAATGRFVGIHLVLATQRPTTDIITGTIKANIPARVSFSLPSAIDSRTILDSSGAEHLLGKGDMLALHDGQNQRLQSYFVSYEDLEELLKQIVRG